jgi:hypothetical protein
MVRGSKMSELLEFVQNYSTATDTHYHYADFTKNVENIYDGSKDTFPIEMKEQLSTLIFDMEVINGLALCDWDLASRPTEWNDWNTDYKEDADDLKKQLVSILTGLQKEYLRILD